MLQQSPEIKYNSQNLAYFYDSSLDIFEIGVDEVGRGPLFGPVYTAAVVLPKIWTHDDIMREQEFYDLLKDSKKLTTHSIKYKISELIKQIAVSWSISQKDASFIDKYNILKSTQLSMHESIRKCINTLQDKKEINITDCLCLIDGNHFNSLQLPDYHKNDEFVTVPAMCVIKGDNSYCSIAAASILAKVARDEYILELCQEYPELQEKYNLASNKGYGAKKHLEGIAEYGVSEWHRLTFGVCKKWNKNYVDTSNCLIITDFDEK